MPETARDRPPVSTCLPQVGVFPPLACVCHPARGSAPYVPIYIGYPVRHHGPVPAALKEMGPPLQPVPEGKDREMVNRPLGRPKIRAGPREEGRFGMVLSSRPGSSRVWCRPIRRWRVCGPFSYNVAGPDGSWEAVGDMCRAIVRVSVVVGGSNWRAGERWQHRRAQQWWPRAPGLVSLRQ